MIGVGEVYSWYVTGRITRDDEVALAHGDADSGYKPLSEPLVNIRATLARGVQRGEVSADEHDVVLAAASLYFPDRTIEGVLQGCRMRGLDHERVEAARRLLEAGYV